jgi:hypothetical protein
MRSLVTVANETPEALWIGCGLLWGARNLFRFGCAKVRQKGTKSLKSKKLAMEAMAKRDVAGRLRTLATDLSLSSDKTWLLRRAQEFEHRAALLESQAASVTARHSADRS